MFKCGTKIAGGELKNLVVRVKFGTKNAGVELKIWHWGLTCGGTKVARGELKHLSVCVCYH